MVSGDGLDVGNMSRGKNIGKEWIGIRDGERFGRTLKSNVPGLSADSKGGF
jgi:hypothetical protein